VAKKSGSYIVISDNIDEEVSKIIAKLKPSRVVEFVRDEFKIEDAKSVIAEAYKSESQTKYILLAAKNFNQISQNSLLKILEEPPKNIEFVIVASSKSNLLVTVRSRLPILKTTTSHTIENIDIDFLSLDYSKIFTFLKENARVGKSEAKELVEAIYYKATVVDKVILSEEQLDNFDKAYRLLDLNSKPQNVLSMVLMGF